MFRKLVDRILSASEARSALPSILDLVAAGEEVTITRHGVPVAVVVRPDALRTRRADSAEAVARQVEEALSQARRSSLPAGGMSIERAEEQVASVRASRADR